MVAVEELLELACDLARQAGRLLLDRPQDLDVHTKTTPTDVVTRMDTAAERLIVDGLRAARPDDAIVAEEGDAVAGETDGVRWVVDPLDGTVNYLYGIPAYAVSIAAEVGGRAVVGVVHDPTHAELYTAIRGRGSMSNDERLAVSSCAQLGQALVGTGFGYAASRRAAQARVLAEVLPRVRDVRRIGAAALDLCAVGAGRLDAYYERGLQPWDLAAGRLIAAEAGAVVRGLHGAEPGEQLVIAANPALFPALHDLLAGLSADRD